MGSENGKFSTPKVLAARPNLHKGMQASLWPEDNKQKDVDLVQICLKYDSAAMHCRHAKKGKKYIVIRIHSIIHWDNIRKGHTVSTKECRKLGWCSFMSFKMLMLKDWSVSQVESVWVSHPAKSRFDKIRQHSSLVKYVSYQVMRTWIYSWF